MQANLMFDAVTKLAKVGGAAHALDEIEKETCIDRDDGTIGCLYDWLLRVCMAVTKRV